MQWRCEETQHQPLGSTDLLLLPLTNIDKAPQSKSILDPGLSVRESNLQLKETKYEFFAS